MFSRRLLSFAGKKLFEFGKMGQTIRKTFNRDFSQLKEILEEKICCERERILNFRKECGHIKVGDITVNNIYGGMRGLLVTLCETSSLDPNAGIRFRGYSIPEVIEKLPTCDGGEQPMPEGVFWLLLTGEMPTEDQVIKLSQEWGKRAKLPDYAKKLLDSFPKQLHPMSQLSCALTALNCESQFVKAYKEGKVKKTDYWKYVYEDTMNILAVLPTIAAKIYTHSYNKKDKPMCISPSLDWSGNFAQMLGNDSEDFAECLRLYLTIHCDHSGGNVSAHTVHLVGSALSDPYLSLASGMNGLAGPLHGLANQEVLIWLNKLQEECGCEPSDDQLKEFVNKTLESGRVIPGYGHAVLRVIDSRFISQKEFAEKKMPDDPGCILIARLCEIIPPILKKLGKVQNPYPNVDAHSGVLLQHYGLTEMNYYTVLFGVSRAIGVLSSLIWARGLGLPIERPRSISTNSLICKVEQATKKKNKKKNKGDDC